MSTRFADHIIGPDIHANRPAAGDVPAGTVFACTTHSKLEQSDGSTTWIDYFAGGGSASVATDAIWDAAGDLALGTGADTAARLPIGSSGKVLQSNGTTASWETPAGGTTIGRSQLIYRYTVAGSDKASIDTGVDTPDAGDNVWSGGDLLEVHILARTDDAAAALSGITINLNNDTSALYDAQELYANNATVGAGPATAATRWQFLNHGSGGSASYASTHKIIMPGYAVTTFWKTGEAYDAVMDATVGNIWVIPSAVGYRSTSAITRLALGTVNAGQKLKVGSQLLIYKRLAS